MPLTCELGNISPVTEHCVYANYAYIDVILITIWKYKPQYNK